MAEDIASTRTVAVRPSEDGVQVEAGAASGGEIALISWVPAATVAGRTIDRGACAWRPDVTGAGERF